MIVIPGLSQPLKAAGKRINSWVEDGDKLMVEAHSTVRRAACPRCSTRSSRLHGHCRRAIAMAGLVVQSAGGIIIVGGEQARHPPLRELAVELATRNGLVQSASMRGMYDAMHQAQRLG